MRVLVTRPEPAASITAAELRRRGHEPLLLPLFASEHDIESTRAALGRPHAALAVTSAEAVRVLAALGRETDRSFDKPLFAVGDRTAHAAKALGFHDVHSGDNDGVVLARLVRQKLGGTVGAAHPLLYLTGEPRSPGFETELAALKIPVETCVCYRMRPLAHSKEEINRIVGSHPVDALLLYSSEGARRFFELELTTSRPGQFAETRILCLSEKIACTVPEPHRPKARAAAAPNEASLLTLL